VRLKPTRDALKTVAAQVKTTSSSHGEIGNTRHSTDVKSINATAASFPIEAEYLQTKLL
jgi:hypothetical protein